MKKLFIFIVLALLICGGIYSVYEKQNVKDKVKEDKTEINEEVIENKRQETDKDYGIKFLGYGKYFTDMEVSKYLTDEELDKLEIVLHDGDEYYLILPTNKTDNIIINDFEDGSIIKSAKPGAPVLLRTNVSDIIPNTYISVRDKDDKIFNFEPFVSLKDGSVTLTENGYELKETFKSNIETKLVETDNYSLYIPTDVYAETIDDKISLYKNEENILTTYFVTNQDYIEPLNEIKIYNTLNYLAYESMEDININRILLSIKLNNN